VEFIDNYFPSFPEQTADSTRRPPRDDTPSPHASKKTERKSALFAARLLSTAENPVNPIATTAACSLLPLFHSSSSTASTPGLAADAIPFPPPIQLGFHAWLPRKRTHGHIYLSLREFTSLLFSSSSRSRLEETTTSCLVKNRGGEPKGAAFFSRASARAG